MSRPSLALLPVLVLLTALVGSLWWLPNRPHGEDVAMRDAKFNSVSLAPFRPGQSPLADRFPSAAEVEQDVALIAGRSRAIRTYAALEGDYDVAAIAQRHGLKLWLGIWLGSDRAKNAAEMAQGIATANRYPDTVERVIVGNEVLLRRDLPVAELTAAIDRVKAAVRQPVTYADVWEFWAQFPEVARHVDIVTIHLLPYWEDRPTGIDAAVGHVRDTYRRMVALFPGKPVAIGETGWPSRGRWRADAAPGRVNQALFLRRFIATAEADGFDYNLIEAFDQDWKYRSEGTVGANWGLSTSAREPKFPFVGAVVEDPDWPAHAAATVLVSFFLLAGTLACWPDLGGSAQIRLAALATALGAALVFAWVGTVPVVYGWHLAVAAAFNLAGQALLAALLLRRTALILTGRKLPPARSGSEATETVQALLRLRSLPPLLRRWRDWALDDLNFAFLWTAACLQLLLLFDPRYRDFPLPVFAVPLVGVVARALLSDLPRGGGGREEIWAGGTLALAAVAGAIAEGPANLQSLAWSAAALVLAAPPLLRACGRQPARETAIA
jgi:exo-beta-1,3-glucanase (GH17 family)